MCRRPTRSRLPEPVDTGSGEEDRDQSRAHVRTLFADPPARVDARAPRLPGVEGSGVLDDVVDESYSWMAAMHEKPRSSRSRVRPRERLGNGTSYGAARGIMWRRAHSSNPMKRCGMSALVALMRFSRSGPK